MPGAGPDRATSDDPVAGPVRDLVADPVADPEAGPVLVPGRTCSDIAVADRFATIVDGADYLLFVKAAMLRAERRILLIGWDFDSRTAMERGGRTLAGPNYLGALLQWMLWQRPELDIYLLKSNLRLLPAFDGMWFGLTPVNVLNRLSAKRLHLEVDGAHPLGAVHHQKLVVIDDSVAFCGGIDLTLDRWDTSVHASRDQRRQSLGTPYGPRHEVALAVDGAAAEALAAVARDRWWTATGESLEPLENRQGTWPRRLEPSLRRVAIGVARTLPELPKRAEVREIEALNLAAIAAARDVIYLENQYLAARRLAEAVAARLREPEGPEVVIVLPRSSESPLERQSMDSARQRLVTALWAADAHGRLGVYWPVAAGGTPVYVHSKVVVADDRLLRIGSSNLNNRSQGFDSECDVALEARDQVDDAAVATEIARVRDGLISEHLGVSVEEFRAAMAERGSFLAAVEALRGAGRSLRRFTEYMVSAEASPLAENDLMDPDHVPRSVSQSVWSLFGGILNAR